MLTKKKTESELTQRHSNCQSDCKSTNEEAACPCTSPESHIQQVNSAFYPPWDRKMSISLMAA